VGAVSAADATPAASQDIRRHAFQSRSTTVFAIFGFAAATDHPASAASAATTVVRWWRRAVAVAQLEAPLPVEVLHDGLLQRDGIQRVVPPCRVLKAQL
jgi:hypothetical protein